eukprot:494740-Amphidinium_carterae.3
MNNVSVTLAIVCCHIQSILGRGSMADGAMDTDRQDDGSTGCPPESPQDAHHPCFPRGTHFYSFNSTPFFVALSQIVAWKVFCQKRAENNKAGRAKVRGKFTSNKSQDVVFMAIASVRVCLENVMPVIPKQGQEQTMLKPLGAAVEAHGRPTDDGIVLYALLRSPPSASWLDGHLPQPHFRGLQWLDSVRQLILSVAGIAKCVLIQYPRRNLCVLGCFQERLTPASHHAASICPLPAYLSYLFFMCLPAHIKKTAAFGNTLRFAFTGDFAHAKSIVTVGVRVSPHPCFLDVIKAT